MRKLFSQPVWVAVVLILATLIGIEIAPHKSNQALSAGQSPAGIQLLKQFQEAFVAVVERVEPVVVNISAEKIVRSRPLPFHDFPETPFDELMRDFFNPPLPQKLTSLGSGVIIRKDGYILTNAHVIRGASNITVIPFKGKPFKEARVIGMDTRSDLAVIKIGPGSPPVPLQEAVLGNSDAAQVGSWAIAVGNPYGFQSTVTVGVISGKGRELYGGGSAYQNLIQTDASINPGNSGGPLVNIDGEVIGINTAIASPSGGSVGIGFAVPVNLARRVVAELIEKGRVTRAWIGVYLQELTPELASRFGVGEGVLVGDVIPGSPAEEAGIVSGDVIVACDGEAVASPGRLTEKVSATPVGGTVLLKILRKGKEIPIQIKTREFPAKLLEVSEEGTPEVKETPSRQEWLGMTVQEITPKLALHLRLTQKEGVLVVGVEEGSLAYGGGIRQGDLITKIEDLRIARLEDFDRARENFKEKETLLFLVKRGSYSRFFLIAARQEKG